MTEQLDATLIVVTARLGPYGAGTQQSPTRGLNPGAVTDRTGRAELEPVLGGHGGRAPRGVLGGARAGAWRRVGTIARNRHVRSTCRTAQRAGRRARRRLGRVGRANPLSPERPCRPAHSGASNEKATALAMRRPGTAHRAATVEVGEPIRSPFPHCRERGKCSLSTGPWPPMSSSWRSSRSSMPPRYRRGSTFSSRTASWSCSSWCCRRGAPRGNGRSLKIRPRSPG